MDNLLLAAAVVFPLFCMMALGYILRAIGLFEDGFLRQLNLVCFRVFLPTVLFINIYESDFYGLFSIKLIVFAIGFILLALGGLLLIIPRIEHNNHNRGVVIQGIFRSNYILFGVPIASALYGAENTGTTAILIAFVIPLFNLLSILVLSLYSSQKITRGSMIKEILSNPLILASAMAFLFILTKVSLPHVVETTIEDIAGVATPLALIILGGSFRFSNVGKYKKLLWISVGGKLMILPAIFTGISILVGFRGMELGALMAMFASPTAVSTFTMAQSAQANDELAGQIVVFTSMLSIVTLCIWITLLKSGGFM
ncbi:MAG: AEC family transporter [Eubacteriales bacterium]